MHCKHCGEELPKHAKFCISCGHTVSSKLCSSCGEEVPADAKYCINCGYSFRGTKRKKGSKIALLIGVAAAAVAAVVCCVIFAAGSGSGPAVSNMSEPAAETPAEAYSDHAADAFLPALAGEIAQVIPMYENAVAVLYTDGTVAVAGNAQKAEAVSHWSNVTKLFYRSYIESSGDSVLAALRRDGTVVATWGDVSGWTDISNLYLCNLGIAGLKQDGTVVTCGSWMPEYDPAQLTNVRDLVFPFWDGCYALKKDGTIQDLSTYSSESISWTNVRQLCATAHALYAILEDGSIVSDLAETTVGIHGAVKIVDYEDYLLGISSDGRLLTESGELYCAAGTFFFNWEEGLEDTAVDLSRYTNVKDLLTTGGLILLNQDGTVESINTYAFWDFSGWRNIEKIYAGLNEDYGEIIYGIRKDGSVITMTDPFAAVETDHYKGWILQDIFDGMYGVVGLTPDGKLVGDGAYASLDFTVLERS